MNITRTNRNAWIGFGIVVLIALFALAAMGRGMEPQFEGYGPRPFMGAGPGMLGIGFIGMLVQLAVWAAVIAFGLSLLRRFSARSVGRTHELDSDQPAPTPLEILSRRYAAGEISREQFEEMRSVLQRADSLA